MIGLNGVVGITRQFRRFWDVFNQNLAHAQAPAPGFALTFDPMLPRMRGDWHPILP